MIGSDLNLNAPIPHAGFLRKQGQDDARDYIPLHPYVLKLLKSRLLMPTAKVLPSVPDMKTVKKDLDRAGVKLTDEKKRRLDYHALRHTYATKLDRTGCSRATKKKLTRHANSDVTDGYTHAELDEMLTALVRLPSPEQLQAQQNRQVRTGTDARWSGPPRGPRPLCV